MRVRPAASKPINSSNPERKWPHPCYTTLRSSSRLSFAVGSSALPAGFWEITELFRKLIMTAVVGFLRPPGSVTQMWFTAIIGIAFWLLSSVYAPYQSVVVDFMNFFGQLSTVMTLLLVVALQAGMDQEGIVGTSFFDTALLILQMIPMLFSQVTIALLWPSLAFFGLLWPSLAFFCLPLSPSLTLHRPLSPFALLLLAGHHRRVRLPEGQAAEIPQSQPSGLCQGRARRAAKG